MGTLSVNEYRVLGRPRNISPAVWHTLLERLGTPKESEHTSKIVVQEPRAGWAAHQNIRGMMLAGGFQGFPFVYHGAANPHNPINKRDRSLINGPITFAFTDVQDYARIKVTWHKTCFHHLPQSAVRHHNEQPQGDHNLLVKVCDHP
ncbi:hypothetical protein CYMTET_7232 [Cymbomonas tetramitiformis]|uniref:Uncharacterized protein n=2 Tax=Cymbomonas tetramitiformis TaxID=36881 RepID=A0AAE0GVK0_9CHLO|nr:hypothetical protein CYMTET_7232 [Cymbomonas tetramitiformis]